MTTTAKTTATREPAAKKPATKAPTKKATSAKAPANKATSAKAPATGRAILGTFTPKGTDGETHKCSGACGLRLPVRKFPTTKTSGVRVSECRSCRDTRTKAATKDKDAK